ncbi:Eco57I restriction-modification methylase domain-containing protein [Tenacibaculum sp. TC6]|uniref:Eco57I restriction-modification methylase domain-containing protein n=1 Tax=Tenacibaculum sp. TC6 TaxID=3423223 RepID=UPI003D3665DE
MLIKQLVEKYHQNRETYLNPSYNETQLRIDFLDPLFELLGWDIKNQKGKSTNEREVLLEEGLRGNATENTKKPDYTFRLFSERKFFLEAKKPSVKIESINNSAKQVRRYGFTARLKISVLSNFEYLAIYDCSEKVNSEDNVAKSLIKRYHYSKYEECFEEIKEFLSYESVYTGKFDEVWQDIEEQLKKSSVDSLFLSQINEWREIFGNEIFNFKSSNISVQSLNDIVQSYINSIIFLRVCEDRNLEVYKTLLSYADSKDFKSLIDKFKEADKKYNAGLFDLPFRDEIIENNQSAFWKIIKELYFPESSYSFTVFSSNILGNIYEMFLGEQLNVDSDGIVFLEKKPENVDRDIVTTPTFIIRDILRETISEFCKEKTDEEILNSTYADIACGSGAFLLEAYQLLQDLLIDYYLLHDKSKLIQTSIDTYKLKFEIKKKLLENCIYGIDKDFSAVEACKFGLLLKLLEDEDNLTVSIPILPNLENIQYGNSLIEDNMVREEDKLIINPFNFNDLKFDVIIGNPPYMATEHMKEFTPLELPLYKEFYYSSYMQFDKYFLFVEKGIRLLKEEGYLGYITPSKFLKVGAGKKLREILLDTNLLKKIVSFGANQVFQNKTTYTCLLILKKEDSKVLNYTEVPSLRKWVTRNINEDISSEISYESLEKDDWILIPNKLKDIFDIIFSKSIKLGDLVGKDNIYNGIQTSANNVYIHQPIKEDKNYFYFIKDKVEWKVEKELTRPYYKTGKGTDNLNTYRPFVPNSFVIYPYLRTKSGIEFVEINKLKNDFPCLFNYLMNYESKLNNDKRDIKPIPETSEEWYRYGRHQSLDKCDVSAKIIVGVLSQGDKYAIDYHQTLISSGGTAGYCMITLPEEFEYSIYYIQALLNSKYLEWFSALNGEVFRGGYIARGTKVLKKLPIRVINFNNIDERRMHDRISILQENLIKIQGEIDENIGNRRIRIPLGREFNNKKRELEEEIKKLYNLGDLDELIPLISELHAIN